MNKKSSLISGKKQDNEEIDSARNSGSKRKPRSTPFPDGPSNSNFLAELAIWNDPIDFPGFGASRSSFAQNPKRRGADRNKYRKKSKRSRGDMLDKSQDHYQTTENLKEAGTADTSYSCPTSGLVTGATSVLVLANSENSPETFDPSKIIKEDVSSGSRKMPPGSNSSSLFVPLKRETNSCNKFDPNEIIDVDEYEPKTPIQFGSKTAPEVALFDPTWWPFSAGTDTVQSN